MPDGVDNGSSTAGDSQLEIAAANIIADLLKSISLKGKTQKLSWADVNSQCSPYAVSFATKLKATLTSDQYTYVAAQFPLAYRRFVGTSDWWEASTRNTYFDAYERDIVPQKTEYDRVRVTVWDAAMWILGNVDASNPATAYGFFKTFFAQTLTPILENQGVTFDIPDTPGGVLSQTSAVATTPTPKLASLFSGGWLGYLVLAGLLGAAAYGVYHSRATS